MLHVFEKLAMDQIDKKLNDSNQYPLCQCKMECNNVKVQSYIL